MDVKEFVAKVRDMVEKAHTHTADGECMAVGCSVPWGITQEELKKELEQYPYIVKYDVCPGEFNIKVLLKRR